MENLNKNEKMKFSDYSALGILELDSTIKSVEKKIPSTVTINLQKNIEENKWKKLNKEKPNKREIPSEIKNKKQDINKKSVDLKNVGEYKISDKNNNNKNDFIQLVENLKCLSTTTIKFDDKNFDQNQEGFFFNISYINLF